LKILQTKEQGCRLVSRNHFFIDNRFINLNLQINTYVSHNEQ